MSTSNTEPAARPIGATMPGPPGSPRVVVAGEALVDVVLPASGDPEEAPGGSPLNVAVGLARLGVETLLVTELGDDGHGRLVRDHVLRSGVRLHADAVAAGRATSTATAHLDEHGSATYDFDLHWTLAPVELPEGVEAVHVGSVGALLRPGRDSVLGLATTAAQRGALVSYDPNARPALTPDPASTWQGVREVAAVADLVKLSDEDLAFLQPGSTPAEVAATFFTGGTRLVVVTHGGHGAVAMTPTLTVEVPSQRVQVVDTVGAGDSFMSALMAVAIEHGLDELDEDRLTAYLTAAHQVGQVTVSRRGADPPWRQELPPGWPGVPTAR